MLELLAQVQHPNIADILDVYFYDGQLCIVNEYLDVSLLDLEFKRLVPEEWEIATIVAEVIVLCFTRSETYSNHAGH
jgi:serine/threonine protein kinase